MGVAAASRLDQREPRPAGSAQQGMVQRREARSGLSPSTSANRGEDLLGRHVDSSPLAATGSEALHRCPPQGTLVVDRWNQMRDRLPVAGDSYRLAVLDDPQQLREARPHLGRGYFTHVSFQENPVVPRGQNTTDPAWSSRPPNRRPRAHRRATTASHHCPHGNAIICDTYTR